MAEPQNASYTIRNQGGALRIKLQGRDVQKAVKKMGQESLVALADDVAGRMRELAPVDSSAAGARRRAKQRAWRGAPRGRPHIKDSIRSGPTKIGYAYVSVGFPASFVIEGHAIRKTPKGAVVGRAAPHDFARPALDQMMYKINLHIAANKL